MGLNEVSSNVLVPVPQVLSSARCLSGIEYTCGVTSLPPFPHTLALLSTSRAPTLSDPFADIPCPRPSSKAQSVNTSECRSIWSCCFVPGLKCCTLAGGSPPRAVLTGDKSVVDQTFILDICLRGVSPSLDLVCWTWCSAVSASGASQGCKR